MLVPLTFYKNLGVPDNFRAETSAIITFVAFQAAYFAEIVRAGIQSIPRGQKMAGTAMGLTLGHDTSAGEEIAKRVPGTIITSERNSDFWYSLTKRRRPLCAASSERRSSSCTQARALRSMSLWLSARKLSMAGSRFGWRSRPWSFFS